MAAHRDYQFLDSNQDGRAPSEISTVFSTPSEYDFEEGEIIDGSKQDLASYSRPSLGATFEGHTDKAPVSNVRPNKRARNDDDDDDDEHNDNPKRSEGKEVNPFRGSYFKLPNDVGRYYYNNFVYKRTTPPEVLQVTLEDAQYIIEAACYDWACRYIPRVVETHRWMGGVDIQLHLFYQTVLDEDIFAAMLPGLSQDHSPGLFKVLLERIRCFRHFLVYRTRDIPIEVVTYMLDDAQKLCRMMGDRERMDRIAGMHKIFLNRCNILRDAAEAEMDLNMVEKMTANGTIRENASLERVLDTSRQHEVIRHATLVMNEVLRDRQDI